MRPFLSVWFALISISTVPASAADAIGSVYSGGAYRADGVGVRGNATLFEGSTVEIGEVAARIHLANGVGMWLAPRSRATMSARGVRLLAGMGQFEAPPEYRLEARAVRVAFSQPHTTVSVALDETGGAVVAPLDGAVQVTNAKGIRVGELVRGSAVRFADRSDTANTVSVSGCLSADRDRFTLTDTITNVRVRLAGRGLEREVGHIVDISGVEGSPAGDTTSVVVTAMRRVSDGECRARSASTRSAGLLALARPPEVPEQLQSVGPRLMLVVLEGEGATNNIRQRTAREPIVEVQDENHRPVAGALVLFALPRNGAGATFPNGATSLRVTTDAQGRAVARGLRPNNVAGQFQIAISASYGALTASITVHQVNSITQPTSGPSPSNATAGAPANLPQVDKAGGAGGDSAAGATTGGTTSGGAGAGGAQSGGAGTGNAGGGGAGGAGTGGGVGSGAGTGIGVGAKVAIIGGLTATAVGGGLAAAGVFGGGAEPAISR